ncbi:PA14 domain-containing protein, partial [Nibrella viscosa]|uniref:PA14 domain-containing protein n=1 Tax=Nibrella viscosa TaxID=1084524 RepID=UPI0031E92EE1
FWGWGSPQPGVVNIDHFSVRWSGQIEAPVTGTYIFRTNNDDGTRLWINNQLLIDNWALQAPTPREGSIQLVAGQKYSLTMEYFEYDAGAQALLMWLVPGTSTAVAVPKDRLYPASQPTTNQPPTLAATLPNQQATIGIAFNFSIPAATFSDPDGDVLTYQVSGLPAGLSANGLTISGTPTTAGTSTITVRATDPAGLF